MCGPDDSCLGRDHEPIIKRFMDGLPGHFPVAQGPVRICGAIVDIEEPTGKAFRISRVNESVES
jgi:calcineurin-like phosphoesterase